MEARKNAGGATPSLGQAPASVVSGELARILQSESFQCSPRQRKFLSIIVDRALHGKAKEIKEATLAVMVYGRHPSSFDAQRDPIVRVEAARLRLRLARYYAGPGADSPLRITIPKGHYRAMFVTPTTGEYVDEGRGRGSLDNIAMPGIELAEVVASDGPSTPGYAGQAVDCFHRGQYASQQRDAAMYAKAIELFRKAIALDPRFAAPYAALALALLNIAGFVLSPSGPLLTEAAEAAQRALALDPASADAYTALAAFTHRFHWNWADAERLFQKAIALAPKSAVAHASFGYALTVRGRFPEAAQYLRLSRQLDPLNVSLRTGHAQMLYFQRRHADAEAELTGLLEIAPKHAFAEWLSGVNALYSGNPGAARAAFERASEIFPDHPSPRLLVSATLALEGRDREARDYLAALLSNLRQQHFCRYHMAIAYAYLRDRDGMYAALDEAAATRDILLVSSPVEPAFDAYRADGRFRSFLDAHRLPLVDA